MSKESFTNSLLHIGAPEHEWIFQLIANLLDDGKFDVEFLLLDDDYRETVDGCFVKRFGFGFSHGPTIEFEAIGVVNDAVKDGISNNVLVPHSGYLNIYLHGQIQLASRALWRQDQMCSV